MQSYRLQEFKKKAPRIVNDELIKYLDENGYFIKPASIKYHGTHDGALYDHSKTVAEMLKIYTECGLCKWERKESPFVIGMFHDLCKLETYKKSDNGWVYDNGRIHTGHGEFSLILLMNYMKLTQQEIACIRWHMGAFCDSKDWEQYGLAVKKYKEVLYTHTADMHASKVIGV